MPISLNPSRGKLMKCKNPLVLILPLLLLSSCGGSSSGGAAGAGTSTNTVLSSVTGQFIDAPVEGLNYSSTSYSGVTGTNGSFNCALGEEVTFKLGTDLTIGKAGCGKKIFLDSLDTKANKAAIGAVLQSLGLSGSVIVIPTAVRTASMTGIDFSSANDGDIISYLSIKHPSSTPVGITTALAHIDAQREANVTFDADLKEVLDFIAWFTAADGNNTDPEPARYSINEDVHIVKNVDTDCEIDFYMSLYKKLNGAVEEYYVHLYTAANLPSGDGQRVMSDVFSTTFNVTENSGVKYAGQGSAYIDITNKKLKGKLNYVVSDGGQSLSCSATINESLE